MKKFLMFILCFICLFGFNGVNAEEVDPLNPVNPPVEDLEDNNQEELPKEEPEPTDPNDSDNIEQPTIPEDDNLGEDDSVKNEENVEKEETTNNTTNGNTTNNTNQYQPPVTTKPINGTYSYTSKNPTTEEKKLYSVEVSNIDLENNKELAGSKLQIQDKDGKVIEEWKTTNKKYIIEDLEEGTYYLLVVSTLEDYEVKNDKIEFVVNSEKEKIEVKVENVAIVKVPDSLSSGSILLLTIAMLDIAIGIGIIVYVKQNKIKE